MKPISVRGLLGGHYGQMPMGKFGQDAGFTPLLFFEEHTGIFNDHRESGPWFNVSSEGWCFLQYSVPVTTLGRQDPHRPQGAHPLLAALPTATTFSQEVFHPGTVQAQPCLSLVGNRSWAAG